MKHYVIIETNVTEPSWVQNYLAKVTPMLAMYGGKYLSRTPKVSVIEGDISIPQFSLLAEFPSRQLFDDFYNSEEYAPFKLARQQGSVTKMLLVPAEGGSE